MEGQATTVYAQGGRGNARLMAWEGERTVTFTMEDALISPISFSILSGAGLIEAKTGNPIIVHKTEQTSKVKLYDAEGTSVATAASASYVEITLTEQPYLGTNRTVVSNKPTSDDSEDFIYVMVLDDQGEVTTEPYIATEFVSTDDNYPAGSKAQGYKIRIYKEESANSASDDTHTVPQSGNNTTQGYRKNDLTKFANDCVVLVDYYVAHESGAYQIDITPDKFGGNFYLEASTLFRAENGQDMPAEFIIPNCKIQSNFTFSMASSGDPSTFTFTMDAFPDYTRWDKTKKVFAAIQVINTGETNAELERLGTGHDYGYQGDTTDPYGTYLAYQKQYIDPDGID